VTQAVLNDWRTAPIERKLRVTIGFLEKLVFQPGGIDAEDIVVLRQEGLTDRAIIDAIYICAGFSVIVRIADALDFQIPPQRVFDRAAKLLLIVGYKLLSGLWFDRHGDTAFSSPERRLAVAEGNLHDPYSGGIAWLKKSVLSGPGFLESRLRKIAAEPGNIPGVLGSYVKKVAHNAYDVTNDDILWLRKNGYTEDQIFEATVSAALGTGLLRIDSGLKALQAEKWLSSRT
jgi:alkylhydroperoxidase family enzyme